MKTINMKQFAEKTQYPYELIRAIAKQHGSWKALVEHVKLKGGINPIIGFNGFILTDDCFEFFKNNSENLKRSFHNVTEMNNCSSFRDRVEQINKISMKKSRVSFQDACSLLDYTHSNYAIWYNKYVWYVLKDIGNKVHGYVGGD